MPACLLACWRVVFLKPFEDASIWLPMWLPCLQPPGAPDPGLRWVPIQRACPLLRLLPVAAAVVLLGSCPSGRWLCSWRIWMRPARGER